MDPTTSVIVLVLFLLTALGAWIIPKERPPRKPDRIFEEYDLHRRD